MGDQLRNFEMAISWGDELIHVLDDRKGFGVLVQTLEHLRAIQFSCDDDFSETHGSLQDLQKKLHVCKEKTDEANSEIADEEEIERLQKELDEELELECKLKDELRFIADELKDLNSQEAFFEEHILAIKRNKQEQLRTEKKLSMYASVTRVIPNIDDSLKTSGYMVDRDKRLMEKFEFDSDKSTAYETYCCKSSLKCRTNSRSAKFDCKLGECYLASPLNY
ncbi:uncharacterized protein LOC9306982 isoform X3 [Arabidopsis lyrata subsp. lyrata]|uniref:uncharacterized protein LOC9306982 isoform X3 n=1 Tax=Arabidopsis lyrata subsp. lyrata TaxID=81972 RepID=UPI000A29B791|nr:uncharacterized protein LOC9306982 isoform X3 [Arabidopsis lyrata subsp. lyrata]|eukprot:XP_020878640.1 uncharacterized protein LOC9306982 isoform X3 [Arabidopsis lyrata subsp. lyrata]